jgi:beta-alanine degradation protein BauB
VPDPTITDPDKYKVIFENERVRVLDYQDEPGGKTNPHDHPDSVMYTLSAFRRRLSVDGQSRDVSLEQGEVRWLDAPEPHRREHRRDPDPRPLRRVEAVVERTCVYKGAGVLAYRVAHSSASSATPSQPSWAKV